MGLIRFLLAISIIVSHTSPIPGVGFIGGTGSIQSFFIISGFFIALVIDKKYSREKSPVKSFWLARAIRIYPVYWTMLLFELANLSVYLRYWGGFLKSNIGILFYIIFSNLFIFGSDLTRFLDFDPGAGRLFFSAHLDNNPSWGNSFLLIEPAWTLGIFLLFYLAAPYLMKQKNKVLFVLMVLSLALRAGAYQFGFSDGVWRDGFFPFEIAFFIAGMLVYRFYKNHGFKTASKAAGALAYLATIAVIIFYNRLFLIEPYRQWSYYFLLALVIPLIFELTRHWKFDRYIGELSLVVYLSHSLIINFYNKIFFNVSGLSAIAYMSDFRNVNIIIMTIVFSAAVELFIIRPEIAVLKQKI